MMTIRGDAVAAIIAAGCGYPADEKAEAVAGNLSLDAQADLLAAILRLTVPRGIGSFVEKLTALGGILGDAAGGRRRAGTAVRDQRKPLYAGVAMCRSWISSRGMSGSFPA